jgi:hypothetical protein
MIDKFSVLNYMRFFLRELWSTRTTWRSFLPSDFEKYSQDITDGLVYYDEAARRRVSNQ